MRISDWSSDVCSSDLRIAFQNVTEGDVMSKRAKVLFVPLKQFEMLMRGGLSGVRNFPGDASVEAVSLAKDGDGESGIELRVQSARSEEHTSELQSLMRISSAVFCLKKKTSSVKQLT